VDRVVETLVIVLLQLSSNASLLVKEFCSKDMDKGL